MAYERLFSFKCSFTLSIVEEIIWLPLTFLGRPPKIKSISSWSLEGESYYLFMECSNLDAFWFDFNILFWCGEFSFYFFFYTFLFLWGIESFLLDFCFYLLLLNKFFFFATERWLGVRRCVGSMSKYYWRWPLFLPTNFAELAIFIFPIYNWWFLK